MCADPTPGRKLPKVKSLPTCPGSQGQVPMSAQVVRPALLDIRLWSLGGSVAQADQRPES